MKETLRFTHFSTLLCVAYSTAKNCKNITKKQNKTEKNQTILKPTGYTQNAFRVSRRYSQVACNIEENIHLHSALVFGSKPPNSWMWGLTGLVMPEKYFGHDGWALLKRDRRDRMALLKC